MGSRRCYGVGPGTLPHPLTSPPCSPRMNPMPSIRRAIESDGWVGGWVGGGWRAPWIGVFFFAIHRRTYLFFPMLFVYDADIDRLNSIQRVGIYDHGLSRSSLRVKTSHEQGWKVKVMLKKTHTHTHTRLKKSETHHQSVAALQVITKPPTYYGGP